MKKLKGILSILLIIIITIGLSVSVNAAGANQIIIENEKTGHTYSAYQIFKGTLSAGTLTDIDWGTGVDGASLLTELKKEIAFSSCNSAEDVAEIIGTFGNDSESLENFAKIVSGCLSSTKVDSTEGTGEYIISGLDDGYYFIKDSLDGTDSTDAYSKYIVRVAGADVSVKAKVDLPTLTKTVDDESYNNAAIGDDVSFKLTSKVPEMDGYSSYNFVVTDNISSAFTMNDDLVVTIDGTALTKDTDYTVSQSGNVLTITFLNMINQKANAGKTVEITYTAELNSTASIGIEGNNTVAYLTYSNDPYEESSSAVSKETNTFTYTTGLKLIKVSSKDSTQKLADATFTITKDGKTIGTITTDSNGEASLTGLAEGTYTISETQAPEGFNSLKNDIEIEISFTYPTDSTNECTVNASIVTNSNNSTIDTDSTGIVELTVPNTTGLQLPTTGGIGTIIFVVIGMGLMFLAVIILVSNQKVRKQRKY